MHAYWCIMKSEKFKELAENRVNRVIDDIRKVANLSNKTRYEYSDTQIKKIFTAIEEATKEAKSQFQVKNDTTKKFSLD